MTGPVLITGASGFIGCHVVRLLRSQGRPVVALTRDAARTLRQEGVTPIACNDWSEAGLARLLDSQHFSVVIHLAAYGVHPDARDPSEMRRANIDLPQALVRLAARRGAAVVMAGSCAEYAKPITNTPLTESSPLETEKHYGMSKAEGGLRALALAREHGVPLRHLRLFNVYGPGEAAHRLLPSLMGAAKRGERVALSRGAQVRDWLYIDDAVGALLRAADVLEHGKHNDACAMNVCTGVGSTVRNFVMTAAGLLGLAPEALDFGAIPMRPDEMPWLVGNPDEIRFDLDWQPTYTLPLGLAAAIAADTGPIAAHVH